MVDFETHEEIANKMAFDPVLNEFNDYIRQYIVDVKEKDFTFYEQDGLFRKVKLPYDQIGVFFKYADACRKAGITMHWTEKQNAISGLDIDIDIKQYSSNRLITDSNISDLVACICASIFPEVFKCSKNQQPTYCIVSMKPSLKPLEIYYKDGIHIRFSGLQLTKFQKRYILTLIKNSKILTDILGPTFKNDVSPRIREEYVDSKEAKSSTPQPTATATINPTDFVDTQSANVPLLLLGCNKKNGKIPYKPYKIFRIKYMYQWNIESIPLDDSSWASTNMMLEYSVNHKLTTSQIQPIQLPLTTDAETKILAMQNEHNAGEFNEDAIATDLDHEVNSMIANDLRANDVKVLLNMLNADRYTDHLKRWKVMIAVANINTAYKPLLEQFCRKKPTFDKAMFDTRYTEVLTVRGKFNQLNYNTLENWARIDNPNAYANLTHKQVKTLIYQSAIDSLKHGLLTHSAIADIIKILYGKQYAVDYRDKKKVWYAFMVDSGMCKPGELNKWREIEWPDVIQANLEKILEPTFKSVMEQLKVYQDKLEKMPDIEASKVKFINSARSNVQKSFKNLGSNNFQKSCILQTASLLLQPGFADRLDSDPLIMGTENGCIQLSRYGYKYKIKEGFHGHIVSKYAPTVAIDFNPDDPITQKLLLGQRALFQHDETDIYEWTMFDACRALDNREKAQLMLIVTGAGSNGKSKWFVEIMANVLGNDFVKSIPMNMIVENGMRDNPESASAMKMQYKGLHAARYEESKKNEILKTTFVKLVASGCGQITSRTLFREPETFKVKCSHVAVSNWDLKIQTKEHAIWRRIRYLFIRNTFKEEDDAKSPYDPKNPFHRKKDKTFCDEFFSDPKTRSRYLSILMFFHMKFHALYDGDLEKVYAPNLDRMTLEYRNREDVLNVYLTKFLIISPNTTTPIRDIELANGYLHYLSTMFPNRTQPIMAEILDELKQSAIWETLFDRDMNLGDDRHPVFHIKKGYRLAGNADECKAAKDETYLADDMRGLKTKPSVYKSEDEKQFLARIKREWAELLERDQKYNAIKQPEYDNEDPLVEATISAALPMSSSVSESTPSSASASTSSASVAICKSSASPSSSSVSSSSDTFASFASAFDLSEVRRS